MIRHLRLAGLIITWIWVLAGTLYAARAPLTPVALAQESELIVTGRILALNVGVERAHLERGFGNYDWAIDLTLAIQSIENGEYDSSEPIVARCFRIKSRKSQWEYFTPGGNRPIPDVGAEVRAHLYRRGGSWRVVHPNGLQPVPDQAPLADAAVIPVSKRMVFTYLLPVEIWICLVVAGVILLGIVRLVRRFRRRYPAQRDGTSIGR